MPLMMGAGVEYALAGNTALYAGLAMGQRFHVDMFVADNATTGRNKFASLDIGVFF